MSLQEDIPQKPELSADYADFRRLKKGRWKLFPSVFSQSAKICAICGHLFLLVLAGTLSAQSDDPGTPLANASAAQARPEPAPTPALQPPQAPVRSAVYSIHEAASISEFVVNASRVHTMVDRLVEAVTGKESAAAGWRSLVEPKDVVGIKISAAGQASGATHRAVVETIIEGLRAAGVPASNIIVWDRDAEDLHAAGYLGKDGRSTLPCQVLSIEPRYGYDPKEVYSAPILGKLIWGDLLFHGNPIAADESVHAERPAFGLNPLEDHPLPTPTITGARNAGLMARENLSNLSHYCTILSRKVTKIVNVPVFSDSYFAGIGGALYNVTIPNVDNWRRLVGPPRFGTTAIPEMYSDPQLGGKIVLNLTDGLVAQIAGGPYFQPLYARSLGTLYASRDAVALDSVVLRLLEIWRAQSHLPALTESAAHVKTAADIGLGNYAADKIDLHAVEP